MNRFEPPSPPLPPPDRRRATVRGRAGAGRYPPSGRRQPRTKIKNPTTMSLRFEGLPDRRDSVGSNKWRGAETASPPLDAGGFG